MSITSGIKTVVSASSGSRYYTCMSSDKMHLVVVISSHGYGHAAMTAPLINSLQQKYSHLRVTLRCDIPHAFLVRKFRHPFEHQTDNPDFGMIMHDAFTLDKDQSLQRYQDYHQRLDTELEQEKARLTQLQADILISNIAYLPLLAARQLNIPAIAYGCLNWAEIFQHYFPEHTQIHAQMMHAYGSADCTIKTEPGMPMAGLESHCVGPIAETGANQRQQLLEALGLHQGTRLVLASMGGIKTGIRPGNWPGMNNVHYLISTAAPVDRPDISSLDANNISFSNALHACDILFTKPGYGSFTEAVINHKAVLYVDRPDWPETPYLCDWLERHNPCQRISRQQLGSGDFSSELAMLLRQPITPDTPSSGLSEAIQLMEPYINSR